MPLVAPLVMKRHPSAADPSRAVAGAQALVGGDVAPAERAPTLAELKARIEAIERAGPALADRGIARPSSGAPASPRGRPLTDRGATDRGDGEDGASPQDAHACAPASHLPAPLPAPGIAAVRRAQPPWRPPWRLGAREIDGLLPAAGLEDDALHEIKPVLPVYGPVYGPVSGPVSGPIPRPIPRQAAAAAVAVAQQLALALASRRLATLRDSPDPRMANAPVLWCAPAATAADGGRPYGQGLIAFGLDPGRLLLAETATAADALWVLEEGLASGCLALAIGLLDGIDLTPARRLSLAAAAKRTPCLLVTSARSAPTGATATRWRAGPAPGADHPFDPAAPGAIRFEVALERCRRAPQAAAMPPISLEWCDETYRFRLAAAVADREMAQGSPGRQLRRVAAG